MQLTVFTDYGLRSLMYLAANPDKICSVREIAEHYGISRNHLVKVAHRMAQLGYITSSKGKGGGIQLAQEAASMWLGDLVRNLEPHMHLVECFERETNSCKIVSACRLQHYLLDANAAFIHSLNQHTLADTVKNKALFLAVTSASD